MKFLRTVQYARPLLLTSTIMALLFFSGCKTAADHRGAIKSEGGERLTVGKVQGEIKLGMSGSEVASVLGSPNIVTTDEKRREVWVYDKISTERVYSASSGGVSTLFFGAGSPGNSVVGGGIGGGVSEGAGASSTTQRTLTVIIKFDEDKLVRDFSYHASKF